MDPEGFWVQNQIIEATLEFVRVQPCGNGKVPRILFRIDGTDEIEGVMATKANDILHKMTHGRVRGRFRMSGIAGNEYLDRIRGRVTFYKNRNRTLTPIEIY